MKYTERQGNETVARRSSPPKIGAAGASSTEGGLHLIPEALGWWRVVV